MNERIEKLALDAGLLNYVDNETPRRYFIDGHADLEEVQKFAELIIQECAGLVEDYYDEDTKYLAGHIIRKHFGLEK
jgi:hypothetical protein